MEEYIDSKGAQRIVSEYISNEINEYRRSCEGEFGRIAPEAKAAFNRKPYGGYTMVAIKTRPVIKAHA
jgi:hypothetical protein